MRLDIGGESAMHGLCRAHALTLGLVETFNAVGLSNISGHRYI